MKNGAAFALAALVAATPGLARGEDLSVQGKAQTCFACHGPEGRSGTPEVPSIAGQPREFVVRQLHLFHDGIRVDAQMKPVTATLSDKDIDELADYIAKLPPAAPEKPADAAITAAAKPLIETGKCTACHGDTLAGQAQAPRLAAQQRAYLDWQLRAYRDGDRADPDQQMVGVVKSLSNKDIRALAEYVSRLDGH